MNILHISAQKPDSTGSGVYLAQTVATLAGAGHAQAVIAGVGPLDEPALSPGVLFEPVRFETEALPFPVVGMSDVMPYRSTRYRDLTPEMTVRFKAAFSGAFDRVFDRFQPDVVICHHLYLVCGVLMDWLERHPDVRARCSVRGVCHNTDLRQFGSHPLERDFIRRGVRALDLVCALHGAQAHEIARLHGIDPARIRVTGAGFNDRVFMPAPAGRGGAGRRLVYVGKIWKQKGLLNLFGALDLLDDDAARGLQVDLIGGFSDEAERDEIADRAAACRVPARFLAPLSQVELAGAYQRSDVFVLPSFSEGLPLVAVEAIACGCKVVLTDLPGIRDWLGTYAPGAPVWFAAPPAMADEVNLVPDPADEPRFERDLAAALGEALAAPPSACDISALSWNALAARLIER
mgnify:CR=1 FL=1